MDLAIRSCPLQPSVVTTVQEVTLLSQQGVGRGGEEIEVLTGGGVMADTGAELCRVDVIEHLDDADEIIDTDSIFLQAVGWLRVPGDCDTGRDLENSEEEIDDFKNIHSVSD